MTKLEFDRRHFTRYVIPNGSLFSDKKQYIGHGRVVDFGRGGVRCMTLSRLPEKKLYVGGVDLYIPDLDLELENLSGRIVWSRRIIPADQGDTPDLCEFRFAFSATSIPLIPEIAEF